MSTDVSFQDESAFQSAIKNLRDDSNPCSWVVLKHIDNNPNLVGLAGSGNGDYAEMAATFDTSTVMYAIIRSTLVVDMSKTVKFVYIYFLGESVPATKRGKIAVTKGAVRKHFEPFHIDFEIYKSDDLSQKMIDDKIAETSFKVDKVKELSLNDDSVQQRGFTANKTGVNAGTVKKSKFGFQGNTPKESQAVQFDDAVTAAINELRDNDNDTNWIMAGFENNDVKKGIVLRGKGNGGPDELAAKFTNSDIAYGLVRVIDMIDGHETTKYGFIAWIGSEVSIIKSGRVTAMKGSITEKFAPYHVDFDASSSRDINNAAVMDKVQSSSGSANKVR